MMTGYQTLSLVFLLGLCSSCSQSKKPKVPEEEIGSLEKIIETASTTTPSVIYRSTDTGRSWIPYANGIPTDATVSSFLAVSNTTYATTDMHGIYRIKEGDDKWLRIDFNLPENIDINAITSINDVLIIGTYKDGILISRNGGHNWEQSNTQIDHTPIRCLLTYKSSVFAGADDGIYKSVDRGNTWKLVYKGVQTNGFTVLNYKIYVALMNGAIMTNDEGAIWEYIYKPHALHDISNDGESIYAMTLGDGLLKSRNDGLSWENVNTGFGETRWYTFDVKNVATRLLAAQWNGIYSMDKSSSNWQIIKNGLPDSTAFSTLETTPFGLLAGIGLRKKNGTNTR